MLSLQFLVSTVDGRFSPDVSNLPLDQCIIVNQFKNCNENKLLNWKRNLETYGAKVIFSNELGLSKSRNLALSISTANICVICDDDCVYENNISNSIVKAFETVPNMDVMIGSVGENNLRYRRRYPTAITKLSFFELFKICSVEMAFKRNVLLDLRISFNVDFGVGSHFVSGEENLLAFELYKSNVDFFYIPIKICNHNSTSSSMDWSNSNLVISKGAMLRKAFGYFGFVLALPFVIKKSISTRSNLFFLLRMILKGLLAVK